MKTFPYLILAAAALPLAGCGGKGGASAASRGKAKVGFTIAWPQNLARVIPYNTKSINVVLNNGTYSRSQVVVMPTTLPASSTVSFDDVPVQSGYTVTATAVPNSDGTGTPIAAVTSPSFAAVLDHTGDYFSIVMQSTVDRLRGTLSGKSFIVKSDGTLTNADGTAFTGPLVVYGSATLTLDTRNSASELVLAADGTHDPFTAPSANNPNATLTETGTTDTTNSAATFSVATTAEGVSSIVVNYQYQSGTANATTFTIPVTFHKYTLTTLTGLEAMADVAPGSDSADLPGVVVEGANVVVQTVDTALDPPTLDGYSTTSPPITNSVVKVARINGSLNSPVNAFIRNATSIQVGGVVYGPPSGTLSDLTGIGTDLYLATTAGIVQFGSSSTFNSVPDANGNSVVTDDLSVTTSGANRLLATLTGTNVSRYVVATDNSKVTLDPTFQSNGTTTVLNAIDVAALGDAVYVLTSSGNVIKVPTSGATSSFDLGLTTNSTTRRLAAWRTASGLLVLAVTDGSNVVVYKEFAS